MRELNAAFADKYLRGYSWSQKNDNDLSYFVTNYLSGNNKNEYMSRKQILDDKLNGNSDELHQEILDLEQNVIKIKTNSFIKLLIEIILIRYSV